MDKARIREAFAAADAYFDKAEASAEFSPDVRAALAQSERNPLMPIVFADGYLAGQDSQRAEVTRLREAIARLRRKHDHIGMARDKWDYSLRMLEEFYDEVDASPAHEHPTLAQGT